MNASRGATARARGLALAIVCLVGLAAGCAEQPASLVEEGAVLYQRHCASCHGASATGGGPVAPSLATPPPDLTTLARRAGGEFDEPRVLMAIDGRLEVAEHGPRDMPVWGAVFTKEHAGEPYGVYRATLDARALADYLRTLQVE